MKRIILLLTISLTGLMLVSCRSYVENRKDIRNMTIRFKPLSKNDYVLVGNLQAEATIAGKVMGTAIVLGEGYANNKKTGLVTNQNSYVEIQYFTPASGEIMTGSLSDSDIQEVVASESSFRASLRKQREANARSGHSTIGDLFRAIKAMFRGPQKGADANTDDAVNFAYFAMVEKYPDIDYFINVRFERKSVKKRKDITETIIVKADGIKLKTD